MTRPILWLPLTLALTFCAANTALASARKDALMTFAVVVGNNAPHQGRSSASSQRLDYADDDAVAMYSLFAALPGEARLFAELDDTTRAHYPALAAAPVSVRGVEEAIAQLSPRIRAAKKAGWRTAFYFFYSGHGDRGEFGQQNEERSYVNLGEAYDSHRLYDLVDGVPADDKHVIVDACRALYLVAGRGEDKAQRQGYETMVQGFLDKRSLIAHPRVGILAATTPSHETVEWAGLEHGLFTYVVRSGLLGGADVNQDGRVSYEELEIFAAHAFGSVKDKNAKMLVRAEPPQGLRSTALVDLRRLKRGVEYAKLDIPGRGRGPVELHAQLGGGSSRPYATVNLSTDLRISLLLVGRGPFEVIGRDAAEKRRAWRPLLEAKKKNGSPVRYRLSSEPTETPQSKLASKGLSLFTAASQLTVQLTRDQLANTATRPAVAAAPFCATKKRVAIMGVIDRRGDEAQKMEATTLSDTLDTIVRRNSHEDCYAYIDSGAIEELVGIEVKRQLLTGECSETCFAELGMALDASYLFSGYITRLGARSTQFRVSAIDVERTLSFTEGNTTKNGGLEELVEYFSAGTAKVARRLLTQPDPPPPEAPSELTRWERAYYPAWAAPAAPSWYWYTGGSLLLGAAGLGGASFLNARNASDAANQYKRSVDRGSGPVDAGEYDRHIHHRDRATLLAGAAGLAGALGLGLLTYGLVDRLLADDDFGGGGGIAPSLLPQARGFSASAIVRF